MTVRSCNTQQVNAKGFNVKLFDAGGTTRIPPAYIAGSVLVTTAGVVSLMEAGTSSAVVAGATIVTVGAIGVTHAAIRGAKTAARTIKARITSWIRAVANSKDRPAPSGLGGEVVELLRQGPEIAPEPGHEG